MGAKKKQNVKVIEMAFEYVVTAIVVPTVGALVYVIKSQTDSIKEIASDIRELTIEIKKKKK